MTDVPEHLLALALPAALILMGLVILICARLLPKQRFLYWCAVGHVFPGVGLALQSFMTIGQMATWSVVTAVLYLSGAAAVAHGISMRFGGRLQLGVVLAIGVQTLIGLAVCSWFIDSLSARIILLNSALGMLYAMALPHVIKHWRESDAWNRITSLSYLSCAGYSLGRAAFVGLWTTQPAVSTESLLQTPDWQILLVFGFLFSMWFTFCLILGAVRDVMAQLREERDNDPLTGRLNRRAFYERAADAFRTDPNGPWFLLSCDIDHFKRINDTYGHETGDEVLRGVGQLLGDWTASPKDLAARFGGEEFILLMRLADADQALERAEGMRCALSTMALTALDQAPTGSFGLSRVDGAADLEPAMRRADALLYKAKHAGRNQVAIDPVLLPELTTPWPRPALRSDNTDAAPSRVVPLMRPQSRSDGADKSAGGRVA